MKYKATEGFKKLENKYFKIHKVNTLLKGGVVEISAPKTIPNEVLATLQVVGEKTKPIIENKVAKKTTKGDK